MNVIFLGCTQNYSYQFSAGNSKVELLAKGLTLNDNSCTIINGIGGYRGINATEEKRIPEVGTVITYPSSSASTFDFFRNFQSLRNDLKGRRNKTDKNILVLLAPFIHIYFLYVLLGHWYNYKIVTISHEWLPTIKNKYWIKDFLSVIYSKTFGWGIHAILPISHYIQQRIEHFKKPMLMTPILAEYPNDIHQSKKDRTFVYCVYSLYYRVITKVIDSYSEYLTLTDNPYNLTLILSGLDKNIDKVRDYIESNQLQDNIIIRSKLPYNELLQTFREASALLIPLDPNSEQDHARFSQKIAEYLSTGTPVISCEVGEIPYYFKDKENMILTDYSANGIANSLLWVQQNPKKVEEIGIAGYRVGFENFNYISFGQMLHDFLRKL